MTLLQEVSEFGGVLIGFVLTLFVLSFVIRDNPLYRVAVHLLVGVSAAFAVVIVVREVFSPAAAALYEDPAGNGLTWIVPLILALLLVLKAIPRTTALGTSAMAVLMAIGAAVAFVGAIAGTLLPQLLARHENAMMGLLLALLTMSALGYFFFTGVAKDGGRPGLARWYAPISVLGRIVITITLAGLFAGVLNTSLVILSQRVGYFVEEFGRLFSELLS